MLTTPNIKYLTDVYFDFGALKTLPDLLKKHKISRPLVITDKGLVKLGLIELLGIKSPVVFDKVETNPTEPMALGALEAYRKSDCDGIVAVGGGSLSILPSV
jgi:4-hydroxybutyrate dehydrogenase